MKKSQKEGGERAKEEEEEETTGFGRANVRDRRNGRDERSADPSVRETTHHVLARRSRYHPP